MRNELRAGDRMWLMPGQAQLPTVTHSRFQHSLSFHPSAQAVSWPWPLLPCPSCASPCAAAFPYPTKCCCILWEIGIGRTLCTTTLGISTAKPQFGWEQFHSTFSQHCLCASPVPLMNSLCIRLCSSCWTGLSNGAPKVLAHASREDHWPNSYSFEILLVANFHWGKILMHCESHRNLIKLESATGWLEDHTAVGTRHNPSSTVQPQLSGTEESSSLKSDWPYTPEQQQKAKWGKGTEFKKSYTV